MILADTSAWVEFDRATGSRAHLRVRSLIADDGPLATTYPVVMEVCSGARSDRQEQDLRRMLLRCAVEPFDPVSDFDGAVSIYRACRQRGVTPRGLIDCMIAQVALRHDHVVLAHDRAFARMADVVGLGLDDSSLR